MSDGTVTAPDGDGGIAWRVPGQIVEAAPFSVQVEYQQPGGAVRRCWFRSSDGRRHGDTDPKLGFVFERNPEL